MHYTPPCRKSQEKSRPDASRDFYILLFVYSDLRRLAKSESFVTRIALRTVAIAAAESRNSANQSVHYPLIARKISSALMTNEKIAFSA